MDVAGEAPDDDLVGGLLAGAAGGAALGVEATGEVGDRLLETLPDGREVHLVSGNQCGVVLGGEVLGKVVTN